MHNEEVVFFVAPFDGMLSRLSSRPEGFHLYLNTLRFNSKITKLILMIFGAAINLIGGFIVDVYWSIIHPFLYEDQV